MSKDVFVFSDRDAQVRRLGQEEKAIVRAMKKDKAVYAAYLATKKAANCGKGRQYSPFAQDCRDNTTRAIFYPDDF